MLDEKCLELLNAEIDGALSADERADLSRRLLEDGETRAAREELRRVHAALAQLPVVEPPAGLRESILSAVRWSRSANTHSAREFWSAPRLRYAATFLAGLVVSAIAFEAMRGQGSISVEETAGTMANPPRLVQGTVADALRVDLSQVRGTVSLFRSPSTRVVEFDLTAKQPVDVVVSHDGREVRLSGFGPSGAGDAQRYALVIDGAGQASAPIEVDFLAAGTVIHRGVLGAPAAR